MLVKQNYHFFAACFMLVALLVLLLGLEDKVDIFLGHVCLLLPYSTALYLQINMGFQFLLLHSIILLNKKRTVSICAMWGVSLVTMA
jgi:hypothetical protein